MFASPDERVERLLDQASLSASRADVPRRSSSLGLRGSSRRWRCAAVAATQPRTALAEARRAILGGDELKGLRSLGGGDNVGVAHLAFDAVGDVLADAAIEQLVPVNHTDVLCIDAI